MLIFVLSIGTPLSIVSLKKEKSRTESLLLSPHQETKIELNLTAVLNFPRMSS